jgi:proteasome alpha subunit
MAGVDDLGCHLFETDPSGALIAYKAGSIGSGRPVVMDIFEKEYRDDLTYDEAMLLGLRALSVAIEEKLDPASVECSVVEPNKPFKRLNEAEIGEFIKKLAETAEKSE